MAFSLSSTTVNETTQVATLFFSMKKANCPDPAIREEGRWAHLADERSAGGGQCSFHRGNMGWQLGLKNILCTLAYSGTHYFGFQKTKIGPSIEESVESALEKILRHPVKIQAASRTDRGVHAEGQVINFFADGSWDLSELRFKLNAVLPKDISPVEMRWAEDSFHPTLHNTGKEYFYSICNSSFQLPFHREHSWHVHVPLDLESMRQGAKILEGKHDFSAFTSLSYEDPVRNMKQIEIVALPENRLKIQIQGDRFLYKMVRTIVGTLVYVGCGKIALADLPLMLESGDRTQAGITAPAHGLLLKKVFYLCSLVFIGSF